MKDYRSTPSSLIDLIDLKPAPTLNASFVFLKVGSRAANLSSISFASAAFTGAKVVGGEGGEEGDGGG